MFVFKIGGCGGHFWKIMVAFWSSLVKFFISECFLWQRLFILLRSRSTFKVKRYFLWSRCTFLFDRRLFWFWLFMVEVNFFNYFKIKENFYDLIDTFQISVPRSSFYFSLIHFLSFYLITPLNQNQPLTLYSIKKNPLKNRDSTH